MWAPKGSCPKVKSLAGRDSVSYSGFVIPSTGQLYICKPDWFTFETTIEAIRSFLEACPPKDGSKYYMILDNAPFHKKAKRLIKENEDGKYSDILEKVVFVYIPPYSPDLNCVEQVWRHTRRLVTHNRYFANVTDLSDEIDAFYDMYKQPNDTLKTLCTFNFKVES